MLVTIPFDYEELPASERDKIVPICIPAHDEHGKRIAWGWFEATAKIQNPLRRLSRVTLHDVYRVSEVAQEAVHGVWRTHGEDFGRSPSGRVYARAKWYARDLQAGTKSQRNGFTLALDELESVVRQKLDTDPTDYDSEYQSKLDLAAISEELLASGFKEISVIIDLMQDGATWPEIGERLGKKPDTVRKRFDRWLERRSDFADRLLQVLR